MPEASPAPTPTLKPRTPRYPPPEDFAAFILTHGRPDRVHTLRTLDRSGYTGPVYLVIDDEDRTAPEYHERFPGRVLTFSKAEVARTFDQADNFTDRRTIVYARNACWKLAEQVGVRYFMQLDDDYTSFGYRLVGFKPEADRAGYHEFAVKDFNRLVRMLLDFLTSTPASTIALAQGGDHFGGGAGKTEIRLMRKAMNSFVLDTHRPFTFVGRVNEDVNTYVWRGSTGSLFFTFFPVKLTQKATQSNAGGMTEQYLDSGTYVKSWYTLQYAPSAVRIAMMGTKARRLHHLIKWAHAVPVIVPEAYRRPNDAPHATDAPPRKE